MQAFISANHKPYVSNDPVQISVRHDYLKDLLTVRLEQRMSQQSHRKNWKFGLMRHWYILLVLVSLLLTSEEDSKITLETPRTEQSNQHHRGITHSVDISLN